MQQTFMNPVDLKKGIPTDLWDMYEIRTASMKSELNENRKIIIPIVLSEDDIALDGYIRIQAAIEIGMKEVPVIKSNLTTSKESRVLLNQYRTKNWKDKRTDYLISFETFGLMQGHRNSQSKYDRYEQIRLRVDSEFKDAKTLRDVEWILVNDLPSLVMSWWLLEKRATVSSLKKIMQYWIDGKYESIIQKVISKELSPGAALKLINAIEIGEGLKTKSFKLPDNNSDSVVIHDGDPEEILLKLESNSIKSLFYEPDRFVIADRDTVDVYGMKIITDVKPYLDKRFSTMGSFFLTVKDVIKDGISLRLPMSIINIVEKETGLTYKQTIYNTSSDPLIQKKVGNQLPDTVSHILWFVKFEKGRMNENIFNIKNNIEIDDNSPLIYKQCTNHINNQTLSDMIVNINDKNIMANASAIIPLYLSTNENDLVVDLSMKGDLAPAATIMNRKFIGVASNRKLYERNTKAVNSVIRSFKSDMTKRLFGTPFSKKVSKRVSSKVSLK